MGSLRILLFGGVRVSHDRSGVGVQLSKRVQNLLVYLLLHKRRFHSREELLDALWPDRDEQHARNCLNTTLWRLRLSLEPDGISRGTYLLTSKLGEVGFNWASDYFMDAEVFEESLGRILSRPMNELAESGESATHELEHALELYTADFLPGVYVDWVLSERERLRSLFIDGLSFLLQNYKDRREYLRGLACGQRILDLDILREEIHREMMRLYVNCGQRTRAVRQYQICRESLQAELGIPPMGETEALYAEILQSTPAPTAGEFNRRPTDSVEKVLRQFETAITSFKDAELALQELVPLLEKFGKQN